ncbi:hypothetical protein LINPERHAP1_LOCUS15109 [Linum perenne]
MSMCMRLRGGRSSLKFLYSEPDSSIEIKYM